MANQAAAAMKNMTPGDMKKNMDQAKGAMAGGGIPGLGAPTAAPPAPAQTCVAKLKASAMSVPDELLAAVEEAEGAKTAGNGKFKAKEWAEAASKYEEGAGLS